MRSGEQTPEGAQICFHCGCTIHSDSKPVDLQLGTVEVCSSACEKATQAIDKNGLSDFYLMRTHAGGAALAQISSDELAAYGLDEVESEMTTAKAQSSRRLRLSVDGMRCAGCAWLVKQLLEKMPGTRDVAVDFALRRIELDYAPGQVKMAELIRSLSDAGYAARPYAPDTEELALEEERRTRLRSLGLGALLGMQVMAASGALYAGHFYGMQERFFDLFRWAALICTIPLLIWPARQFFAGAWVAVRNRCLTMDVPVVLGMSLAFVGSVVAVLRGSGDVYFDSIAMFVVLLSGTRYLEFMARLKSTATLRAMTTRAPMTAWLYSSSQSQKVAAASLSVGDHVLVRPGEVVPADGIIVSGTSSVDEAILTGEAQPLAKMAGDAVLAGAVNHDGAIEVTVTVPASQSVLARLVKLAETSAAKKPDIARLADAAASYFVFAIVLMAAVVALSWWMIDPDAWLGNTIAVLVVTCPCALSLATPAAMTVATQALAKCGLITANADAIEKLAKTTHMVFDKTGTLTDGHFVLAKTLKSSVHSSRDVVAIAAALERHAVHPIADAFRHAAGNRPLSVPTQLRVVREGVSGQIGGRRYLLGNANMVRAAAASGLDDARIGPLMEQGHTLVYLAEQQTSNAGDRCRLLAVFAFDDQIRAGADGLAADLSHRDISVSIASGDNEGAVTQLARRLQIDEARFNCSPEEKLEITRRYTRAGRRVAVVGDGVNDAPALAGTELAIAMGSGAVAASTNADIVMTSARIDKLVTAVDIARKTRSIIRQNLFWAATYNLCAIPAAAAGLLPPWVAALGMSVSSLVVVTNALRAK